MPTSFCISPPCCGSGAAAPRSRLPRRAIITPSSSARATKPPSSATCSASLRSPDIPDASCCTVYVLADNCTDDTARHRARGPARLSMSASTASRSVRATPSRRSSPISRGTSRPDTMATSSLTPITSSPPTISTQMNRTFSAGLRHHHQLPRQQELRRQLDLRGLRPVVPAREPVLKPRAAPSSGTSCAVSGTGFLFSRAVLEETGPWPFHLLTEDIEFSIHEILQGAQNRLLPRRRALR